jgi:hypothetical protein
MNANGVPSLHDESKAVLPQTWTVSQAMNAWQKSMERSTRVIKGLLLTSTVAPGVDQAVLKHEVREAIVKAAMAETAAANPFKVQSIQKWARDYLLYADPEEVAKMEAEVQARVQKMDEEREQYAIECRAARDAQIREWDREMREEEQKNARSHLDSERAIDDERRDTEPGFADAPKRLADQRPSGSANIVSKMEAILTGTGFEADGVLDGYGHIAIFVHSKAEHRIEMNTETGRFRAVSGYDYAVATGEGPDDLTQWTEEEL